MTNLKIGDKIVPKDGEWTCINAETAEADYAIIISTEYLGDCLRYGLYKNGKVVGDCWGCQNANNSKLMEKTMENLQIGDVLVGRQSGLERTVLEVLSGTALISASDSPAVASSWYTFKQLKGVYTIKSDEPETTELTMDEIAKLAGVDVKNLKIKKEN